MSLDGSGETRTWFLNGGLTQASILSGSGSCCIQLEFEGCAKWQKSYASIRKNPLQTFPILSDTKFEPIVNVTSSFRRTSVGLVLGGGGARGAAHVGMIKAILVSL